MIEHHLRWLEPTKRRLIFDGGVHKNLQDISYHFYGEKRRQFPPFGYFHLTFFLIICFHCKYQFDVALKSKMKYPSSSLLHPANTTFEVCSKQHQQEKKSFLLKFSFVHQSCIITKAASWRTASKAASEQNCNGEWPQATSFFYLFFQNWLDRIGQFFS